MFLFLICFFTFVFYFYILYVYISITHYKLLLHLVQYYSHTGGSTHKHVKGLSGRHIPAMVYGVAE